MRGALFETWVVAELLEYGCNCGRPPELHFWRDSSGNEVDVIVERKGRLYPLEIKSGKTVAGDCLAGLERFARIAGTASATLVYGGETGQKRSTATILGWRG